MKRLLRKANEEQAQGLIEFALIAMVLMALFLGAVDYARFLYYDNALQSAVRVGAEVASNHCPYSSQNCNTSLTVTSDTYVLWATYCEAATYIKMTPGYASCIPASTTGWTPTCSQTSCSNCTNDVCVTPSARSSGTQVTVSAGWNFTPISFYVKQFFPAISCYTGDATATNNHTICASSTGKVF